MNRPWILLTVLALGASGCHSPSTTYDPFLGRSTVPPPSTGAVAPGAPYYAPPAGGVAPAFAPPPVANPSLAPQGGPAPLVVPPGGLQQPQPTFQNPPPGAAPLAPPGGFGANNIPSLSPDPRFTAAAAANGLVTIPPTAEPPPLQAPNAFASAGRTSPASARAMFNPAVMPASYNAAAPTASPSTVSANKPVSTSSLRIVGNGSDASAASKPAEPAAGAIVAESSRPGATYSYDSSYRALQGKLEFTQNRWKLRYIPADGETDDFGGSVILSDSPVLSNYQAGDFVSVQGGVAQKSETRGFAPQFQLSRIARQ